MKGFPPGERISGAEVMKLLMRMHLAGHYYFREAAALMMSNSHGAP